MKKVMLVGGGKIGVAITEFLSSTGDYKLTVVDRDAASLQRMPRNNNVELRKADILFCLLHDKKYPEAAAALRTLVEKFPQFESLDAGHFNLGLALYNVALASKKADDFRARVTALVDRALAGDKTLLDG